MSQHSDPEDLAMQYLRGTLSDEERSRLEERYFSDDSEFEEIEIAEEELIDRYVRGELSDPERNRFETTLAASPRLTERVQFARMWKEKLAASPAPSLAALGVEPRTADGRRVSWWSSLFGISAESRAPRLAVAFSLLLILVGGIALLAGWLRLREQSRQLAAQQAALEQRQRELDKQAADLKSQADQLANQTPQPSPTAPPNENNEPASPPTRAVFAFVLPPGNTRSPGGGRSFQISPETDIVRISLHVRNSDYPLYRATINRDGRRVFSSRLVPLQRASSNALLILNIPAKQLPPGDYTVKLDGRSSSGAIESVDDYQFRITK